MTKPRYMLKAPPFRVTREMIYDATLVIMLLMAIALTVLIFQTVTAPPRTVNLIFPKTTTTVTVTATPPVKIPTPTPSKAQG